MGAVPGETPAVMKGPDHRLPGAFQIPEQLLHIQIKAMDIVEVDDIRIVFLYFLSQSSGLF